MYENAIICFTSDHGDMLGDHHHWRKTYAYQGSVHIPYLFQWSAWMKSEVKRGSKLEQPVELRDFLPSFLHAGGAEIPLEMDGESVLNLIQDKKAEWREFIDMEHATCYRKENYWCALTDGKIKYIWFIRSGEEQLFDLEKDPQEIHDLTKDRKYRKVLVKWRDRMVAHLSEGGEDFVKEGKLISKKKTLLLSPNYPEAKEIDLKYWQKELKNSYK